MLMLRLRRYWHSGRIDNNPLREVLSSPLPASRSDYRQLSWLSVDLETTALTPKTGEIASLGWVAVEGGNIQLSSARHIPVRTQNSVGQSAAFHQLRDSELAEGEELTEAMAQFLAAAVGKVLIFHNKNLDMAFLNKACVQLYGAPLLVPLVDTMLLEKRKLHHRTLDLKHAGLRLHECRQRYNLPDYPAHDALVDAIATAELFLAWAAHRGESVRLAECF